MFLLLITDALACGGFFGDVDQPVFSDSQQAIFERQGQDTQVEYLVRVDGDPEDFGWVVPLPGAFVGLEEGDPGRFEDLQELTDPVVETHEARSLGCRSKNDAAGGLGSDTGAMDGFGVVDQGTAGVFDYVALEATDTGQLIAWLETNGWDVGPNGPALDAYVAEGGFQFLALALNQPVEGADTGGAWSGPMASARITYSGDVLRFPAIMSSTSLSETQRTTLYVAGDQRASVTGWQATVLGTLVGDIDASDSELYADRLWQLGGQAQGMGLVWAGTWEDGWVTRFDGWVETGTISADAVFALDAGTEAVSTTIALYESERELDKAEEEASQAALWLWLAPLLALGWGRRRRDWTSP